MYCNGFEFVKEKVSIRSIDCWVFFLIWSWDAAIWNLPASTSTLLQALPQISFLKYSLTDTTQLALKELVNKREFSFMATGMNQNH